jgi:hypothetical protein
MDFWIVTLCSFERAQRFGRTYRLQLQGRRLNQVRPKKKQAANGSPTSVSCLPRLFFNPKDGVDMSL